MGALQNIALGRLPQYTRKVRHLQQVLHHHTPKKLFNMAKAEWGLWRGHTSLSSMPYVYIIDPCNACNLRCPLCPTGLQVLERPTKMMNYDCYRRIIDQIKDYGIEVILHNWGESFLHPRIFDMIRLTADANIGTNISSHFNNITDEMIDRIIDSGLENLTVSLDGVTQDVYEIYRVKGNIENALSGLKRLQARKRERKSRTPVVEWQFIVMKHNEHQLSQAQAIAKELNVERFRAISAGLPYNDIDNLHLAEQWMSVNVEFQGYHPGRMSRGFLYDEPCFYPYRAMTINPDGGVAPCCVVYHKKRDFGDAETESLRSIWNNKHYRSARSLFSNHPIDDPITTVCDGCILYKQKAKRKSGAPISLARGVH